MKRSPLARRIAAVTAVGFLTVSLQACGGSDAVHARGSRRPASRTAVVVPENAGLQVERNAFPVTVKHKWGNTRVPAEPKRVVTLGLRDHDMAIALGVTPIAIRNAFGVKRAVHRLAVGSGVRVGGRLRVPLRRPAGTEDRQDRPSRRHAHRGGRRARGGRHPAPAPGLRLAAHRGPQARPDRRHVLRGHQGGLRQARQDRPDHHRRLRRRARLLRLLGGGDVRARRRAGPSEGRREAGRGHRGAVRGRPQHAPRVQGRDGRRRRPGRQRQDPRHQPVRADGALLHQVPDDLPEASSTR